MTSDFERINGLGEFRAREPELLQTEPYAHSFLRADDPATGLRGATSFVVRLRVEVEVDQTRWSQDACEGQEEPELPILDQITELIAVTLSRSERTMKAQATVRVRRAETTTAPTSLAHAVVTARVDFTVDPPQWWATAAPDSDRAVLGEDVRAHVDRELVGLAQFADVDATVTTMIIP
ncbi:hypothetical protein SUDANB95_07930 (plasmid) [Actinosynnema sp. ALI-1.44]